MRVEDRAAGASALRPKEPRKNFDGSWPMWARAIHRERELEQPLSCRVGDSGCTGHESQFREEIRDVTLHRVVAEAQAFGDFTVGEALGHQFEYFQLALRRARRAVVVPRRRGQAAR